jgi:carboxypeptidase Taq
MTFDPRCKALLTRLAAVHDLEMAQALSFWDQNTYMPEAGAPARGRQQATLAALSHQQMVSPELVGELERLERQVEDFLPGSPERALLRLTRRRVDRALRLPAPFVAELSAHLSAIFSAWAAARPADDFSRVAGLLERTLEYSRRYASYFPEAAHPADPLIDEADEGMTVGRLRPLFAELRAGLLPLIAALDPGQPDPLLARAFPIAEQLSFGQEISACFGFDFKRGRQDLAPHPFMIRFSSGDVRITTRVNPTDFSDALYSTLHETGHALYELGVGPAYEGTPLGGGVSAGVHESQSRLWENLVGRGRAFSSYLHRRLRQAFPRQLEDVDLERFYRAVNWAHPSLIRTEADELTYNLHVILRFDLEVEMLEGRLAVRDLPEAWRARYQSDLGLCPQTDRDGVLQDVHWFSGLIGGAFQGYTLGNLMSVAFYRAALAAHPEIPAELAEGRCAALHGWLREQVYQHGGRYTADELLLRATGAPLSVGPYLDYLGAKFGASPGDRMRM